MLRKNCWSGKTLQILKMRSGEDKSFQIILLEDELTFFHYASNFWREMYEIQLISGITAALGAST